MNARTRSTHVAYHVQSATNGIATVAGHIARLRDLNDAPDVDRVYLLLLTELGEMSATIRKQHPAGITTEAAA